MQPKIFLSLIFALGFLFSFVGAQSFCVDFDPPSAPSNLILTQSNGNILLTWGEATDEPSCSEISHYDIKKSVDGINFNKIGETSNLDYLDADEFPDGTYIYTIYAFDLAGHNEGVGISKTIVLGGENGDNGNGGGSSGGGSSSSSYWECGEWSNCINGTQTRICEDIGGNLPNRTETSNCFPDFILLSYETQEEETETTELTEDNQKPKSAFLKITGAVTETLGTGGTIGVSVFILGIIGAFVFVKFKKRKRF